MSQEDFQQLVIRNFEEIDKRFASLEADIKEVKITSEAYQKASTQVVGLAFGFPFQLLTHAVSAS